MSLHVDECGPPSAETFKFENVGDMVKGKILYVDKFVRTSEFTDLEERVAHIVLETDNGEPRSIWPILNTNVHGKGWASRLAKAIGAAARTKGSEVVEVGAMLAVKHDKLIPTDRGHDAKGFVAQYEPPPAPADDDTAAAADEDDGVADDLF